MVINRFYIIDNLNEKNNFLNEDNQRQFKEIKELKAVKEDQEAAIKYDRGIIKTLMHDNDMAKRNNKELEDKLYLSQEKLNEGYSIIYNQESKLETIKLSIDKHKSVEEGLLQDKNYFKVNHDRMEDKYTLMEQRLNKIQLDYNQLT